MKKMLLLLLVLALLMGCAPAPSPVTPSPSARATPSAPQRPISPETLTILMPRNSSVVQKTRTDYAQKILDEAGFDIRLEVYEGASINDGYTTQYYQEIESRQNENLIFLFSYAEEIDTVKEKYSLKSLRGEAETFAPQYAQNYANIDEEGFIVATGKYPYSALPLDLAVLIKNEVYEQYGRCVSTASEYIELLRWLKDQNPDQIPTAMSPSVYMRMYRSSTILSLVLPEYDQYPLSTVLDHSGPTLFIYDTQTGKVMLPHESEYFVQAVRDHVAWRQEGLIDFWNAMDLANNFSKFPTLLVSPRDFVNSNMKDFVPTFMSTDMTAYHMCVLYQDTPHMSQLPDKDVMYNAAAMQNADTAEFFRFMEWLEDQENYDLFRYGYEGIDYNVEGQKIIYEKTALAYDTWEQGRFFRRPNLERFVPANSPSNYGEILDTPAEYTLSLDIDKVYELFEELDSEFYNNWSQFNSDYIGFTDRIPMMSIVSAESAIDIFIDQQNKSEAANYLKRILEPLNK